MYRIHGTNLKRLWNECLENKLDPAVIGVKAQMSKYDLLVYFCERNLKITDNLNKTIQKELMSASEAPSLDKWTVQL